VKIYLARSIECSLLLLLLSVLPSPAQAQQAPKGAIRKGSLSNQKLISDAMLGVAVNVSQRGCETPRNFVPYVSRLPEGEVGSRTWQEIWVVYGCDRQYPVTIDFSENGANSANWTIR